MKAKNVYKQEKKIKAKRRKVKLYGYPSDDGTHLVVPSGYAKWRVRKQLLCSLNEVADLIAVIASNI